MTTNHVFSSREQADATCLRELRVDKADELVRFAFGGSLVMGLLSVSEPERQRRRALPAVGDLSDLDLLHSLWNIPFGEPISEIALEADVVATLDRFPAAVERNGDVLLRTFQPIGHIGAVIFSASKPEAAVNQAIRFTPIIRRFARVEVKPSSAILAEAAEWGIGILVADKGERPVVLRNAAQPVIGLPTVFRWWLAEHAYRSGAAHDVGSFWTSRRAL